MVKIIVLNFLFGAYITSTGALNREFREFRTIFLTISVCSINTECLNYRRVAVDVLMTAVSDRG